MTLQLDLFPGFPFPRSDYEPLARELAAHADALGPLRVAHSLGALAALAEQTDTPTVLLAPSTPGPRPGRTIARTALRVANRTPLRASVAARLRDASYKRFGVAAPAGDPLSLRDAGAQLAINTTVTLPISARLDVLCSRDDARHPAQVAFAHQLGARVRWVDGGHLFPLTSPAATARAIVEAVDDLSF